MDRDIRGFIPRRHLSAFLRWYESRADRESLGECAKREIREELGEANVATNGLSIDRLMFRRIHEVIEGPEFIESEGYYQYRIFEIAAIEEDQYFKFLITRLNKKVDDNPDIASATQEAIRRNRSSQDDLLSYLAGYIIGAKKKPRYDVPHAKAPPPAN